MWDSLINKNNQQRDVVIVSLPYVESAIPTAAPAALKPIVESTGLTCLAVDSSVSMYNKILLHPNKKEMLDFYMDGKLAESVEQEIFDDLDDLTNKILSWSPKWIGLSLLSADIQNSARWVLYLLREKNSQVKIFVGGAGCGISATVLGSFIPDMFEQNLIDYHIHGDGEIALAELLMGNDTYAGINGVPNKYLTDTQIHSLPFPDYTDYQLDLYDRPAIILTGSRGCVRQCTFCDYIEAHTKFQWRTAESIFSEMLYQIEKYKITKFIFSDSLTNGNIKEFNKLLVLLADYNEKNPGNKIIWAGYYIIRNKSSTDEWIWEMLQKSGAQQLAIGIESFSQSIRYQLGKKIDDESIIHHFTLAQKMGIHIIVLTLVGYPTETIDDSNACVNWLKNNAKFNDILAFSFSTVAITPGTQLDREKFKFGVIMIEEEREATKSRGWSTSQYQQQNNITTREELLVKYVNAARENGFILDTDHSTLQQRYIDGKLLNSLDPRSIIELTIQDTV
jgi:radical SAM superfamily enzyme YgiQ (UPF0313 family)